MGRKKDMLDMLADGELDVEFQDEREQELFFVAALGEEAHRFLRSNVGRYLLARAREDIDEAKEALANVAPWRKRKIQELQNDIAVCRRVLGYIQEITNKGEAAYEQLQEEG